MIEIMDNDDNTINILDSIMINLDEEGTLDDVIDMNNDIHSSDSNYLYETIYINHDLP